MNSARVRLPGHPDAVCDLVAEAIVDEYTRRDPVTRIKLSVMGGRGALFISGDVRSNADFDVSQLISRTLGLLGVMSEHEPFISIEPVVAERAALFARGADAPVTVTGYATNETVEFMPRVVSLARRMAQALEDKRQSDETWFWLGADGEVFTRLQIDEKSRVFTPVISIRVEPGVQSIAEVRIAVEALVHSLEPDVHVRVNESGVTDARSLGHVMGAAGRENSPYGFLLPACPVGIGQDMAQPDKAGVWLARAAARRLVAHGTRAVLVHAVYLPGEKLPVSIRARDERGKDLSREITPASMSLDRAKDWWRPNLNIDAARWGFAGAAGLPWEEEV